MEKYYKDKLNMFTHFFVLTRSSAECTTNENCKKNCQVRGKKYDFSISYRKIPNLNQGLTTSDCGSEILVAFTINKKGKTTLEDAIVSKIGMDCPCYVPPTTTTTTTKPIGKGAKCTDPLVCSSISSLKRNTKYMYIYSDKRYSLSLTMVVPGLGE